MSFQIVYRPLAKITIHHDFYLDDGADKFVDLSDDEKKSQLTGYDFLNFLKITPTPITQRLLQNHKIVLRNTGSELLLFVNVEEYNKVGESATAFCPKVEMTDDQVFTFELRFSDTYFNNYTNSLDASENRLYYFSNKRPDSESNAFPNFFTDQAIHTDFLLQPEGSREIIHDILTKEIAPVDDLGLETILAIDDTDIEVPENAAVLNTYIETQKRNGLLGYIQMMVKGDSNADLLEDVTVEIPGSSNQTLGCLPEVEVAPLLRFENRKTFWQYIDLQGDNIYTTIQKEPLTKKGFVTIEASDLDPSPDSGPGNSGGNPGNSGGNPGNSGGNSNSGEQLFFPNPGPEQLKVIEDDFYSEIFI